jgi:hypothetical protein
LPGLDAYLNPHFNNYSHQPTQDVYQDLIVQSIQMYGSQVYYIPRNINNSDKIYETDDQSSYTNAIPTVVYVESVDGFSGQQDIFTKFGLEIRDQVNLSMARKTFERTVQLATNRERPYEGDIIYFALNQKCFQIKIVNNKEIFYPLGTLPLYRMTLELFEYSDEIFNTGIPEIDILQQRASLNILDYAITNDSGSNITTEDNNPITIETYDPQNIDPITDSDSLQANANPIIVTTETNPFGWV